MYYGVKQNIYVSNSKHESTYVLCISAMVIFFSRAEQLKMFKQGKTVWIEHFIFQPT